MGTVTQVFGLVKPGCTACTCSADITVTHYTACSGPDVLDTDTSLKQLLERLLADWPELDGEHIAVWMMSGDESDFGPRLMARLYAGCQGGRTMVEWM